MPLQKVLFKPGVNRENTRYTNEGGWYQSDKVRFRQGTPEKIGGWARISVSTFLGTCRSLWNWITLGNLNLLGVGTNLKFYIENGGGYNDITPIRSAAILSNPFKTTNLSTTVTVTHAAHGALDGDFVAFSNAATVGGLDLNSEYQITYVDANTYTITASSAATSTVAAGGGTTVNAVYQINVGLAYEIPLTGWGAGSWNQPNTTWGYGGTSTSAMRLWGQNNFGEDLILGYRGSPIYYWDAAFGLFPTTFTITVATPAVVTSSSLTLPDNSPVILTNYSYPAALPTGLTPGTTYYTKYITASTFWLSSTSSEVVMVAACSGSGSNNLTVSSVTSGVIVAGMTVYYSLGGTSTSLGTVTLTGTGSGGAGTYTVTAGTSVGSTTMYSATLINTSGTQSGTHYIMPNAVPVSSLAGANSVPLMQNFIYVSDVSRFVFAFGTNDVGSTVQDPMLIRWSDQESVVDWYPSATNQAGSVRLSHGSEIITAIQTRQEIVVWTDSTLYSLQYLGPPFVWGAQLLGDNISILGQNSVAQASGVVYWMGTDKFYSYDGRVNTLNCDLRKYVYQDINLNQNQQCFASTNEGFNEVWFFYCSANSDVVNKYVVYNYLENTWYYGTMGRSAWLDSGLRDYPIAANPLTATTGNIVNQEYGNDNNETGTPVAIDAYISSSEFDIGDGHNFGFVWRMLPDLTFSGSDSAPTPQLTMTLYPMVNSGSGTGTPVAANVDKLTGSAYTITEGFTGQVFTRVRGRQMILKVGSNQLGTAWQLGATRIDIRPDGRR
jgi:hypothetical protein